MQPGRQWRLARGALGPFLPRSAACPAPRADASFSTTSSPSTCATPTTGQPFSADAWGGGGHTQGGQEELSTGDGAGRGGQRGMVPKDVHVLIPGIDRLICYRAWRRWGEGCGCHSGWYPADLKVGRLSAVFAGFGWPAHCGCQGGHVRCYLHDPRAHHWHD